MLFKNNKIKLSVFERIILLELIDKIDVDFIVKRAVSELENKLAFSDKELVKLEIKITDDGLFWKTEFDKPKNICLGEFGSLFLKKSFQGIKEFLEDDHKELYDKVVNM